MYVYYTCVWKETDLVCYSKYYIGISVACKAIYEYITKFITESTRYTDKILFVNKRAGPSHSNDGEEGRGSLKL